MYKFQTPKDVKKVVFSSLEFLALIAVVVLIFRALFVFTEYKHFDEEDSQVVSGDDKGFVAISYFGVDRDGTNTLISTDRLDEHLKALYDNGYVTVTQADIEAYYNEGKPLPDKALYLMYEDGRKDTAIFAQKIMEEYNDKATILSYAEKFENKDSKFLLPDDLSKLQDSGFWELGTNGYRLSYINVFDRYDRYLGELSSTEFSQVAKYLNRRYNQYLMDFIRDKDGIPTESYEGMKNRITYEYDKIENLYTMNFGTVPDVYVLMHSNTGHYANNDKVSAVNEECMLRLFKMNFNREGCCVNNRDCDVYDLTRMQPQAYWRTNHLLMRIKDDLPKDRQDEIKFVDGDFLEKSRWEEIDGASEFKKDTIAITSESEGSGTIRLKNSADYRDVSLDVELTGNKIGTQSVLLRSDEKGTKGITVSIQNNVFYIYDTAKGEDPLCEIDLYYFDGNSPVSVEEDSKEALLGEYGAFAQNAESLEIKNAYYGEQRKADLGITTKSVEDGADEYVPTLQIRDMGDRAVHIDLHDNLLTVMIDGKVAAKDVEVSTTEAGYLLLKAAWGEYGYSQRNLSDDVYDGIFEKINVTEYSNSEKVLYSNNLKGMEAFQVKASNIWNKVLNWFIKTL